MNKIQRKLNKMTKYTFDYFSSCADFKLFLSYKMVRTIWKEEFNVKYNKEQIIKISIETLWDNFDQ